MILKEFSTNRLLFREMEPEDNASLSNIVSDKRFHFANLRSDEDIERFLTIAKARQTEREPSGLRMGFRLAVLSKESGAFIGFGSIGIAELKERGHIRDIGYFVAPNEWGQGYGKEIAYALCRAGFAYYGLKEIWATVGADNRWSKDILACIGMTRAFDDVAYFGAPPRPHIRDVYRVAKPDLRQPFAVPVDVTFRMEN